MPGMKVLPSNKEAAQQLQHLTYQMRSLTQKLEEVAKELRKLPPLQTVSPKTVMLLRSALGQVAEAVIDSLGPPKE